MKIVCRNLTLAGFFISFAWVAQGAQIEGVLMDKMCSASAVKDAAFAAKHDRPCALMDACTKSGYGVFTKDNRFLTFDEAGNTKALAALKASKKKDNLTVTVDGDVQGDTIKVSDLKLAK
jgi:hypothetical protein